MSEADYISGWPGTIGTHRHLAFEHAGEAMVLIDPVANSFVDVNIAAARLLGYARRELLALPVTRVLGDRLQMPDLVLFTQTVMDTGSGWSDDLRCVRKDGEHVKVEITATHLKLGNRPHLVLVIRNRRRELYQHDKSQTERVMRAGLIEWHNILNLFQDNERDNQLLLTSVGDGIYSIDSEGLATFVNPAAARMLGWPADELLGKNIHRIHHHTHADGRPYPVEECPIYAATRDGVIHEGLRELFWRRDGSSFPVEFTSTPVIAGGRIVGAVVVFRDISERHATELKLQQALNELQTLKDRLEEQNAYLQEEIRIEHNYREIVGRSPRILEIVKQIDVVAPTDANVLIYGESGTGKELIARAIHQGSKRREQPLIRVNCAAIPDELFESEFFGHVRGAFTGAVRDRSGRFELAHGGTLFLDEVGEIPLELQGKLLRVLQEGQFERIGEERTRHVDVRIVAATNRDLRQEVDARRFREDLFFRLNVFPIHSPPLRERAGDIPLLATHFLKSIGEHLGMPGRRLSKAEMQRLQDYGWPGNIRELQNVIERALITSNGRELRIDLPSAKPQAAAPAAATAPQGILTDAQLRELERANLLAALKASGGRVSGKGGAAERLGLKPTTLASRLKSFGIE